MPMNRVAFTLPDVGLREIKGMAYVDDGWLVLKVQDGLLGVLDVEKKEVRIEPAALEDIRIRRGLLYDKLVLTPRRVDLLDAIPGEHRVSVDLSVWRRHRRDLERLLDELLALA
jgi:hypothetical protein